MSYQHQVNSGFEGHHGEDLSHDFPNVQVQHSREDFDAFALAEISVMKHLFEEGSRLESLMDPVTGMEGARAGAEFEIYVLDKATLSPLPVAEEVIEALGKPKWLVKEAAKCVVEINVPPFLLKGNALRELENWFCARLDELRNVPGVEIYLGGSVPSLEEKHLLNPAFFSVGERYQALASRLAQEHGGEEAQIFLPSRSGIQMFRALRLMPSGIFCGIQPHLQLSAHRFVDQYNAAVVSSPLHLAMNANSPAPGVEGGLLESRLELLSQGVDDKRYPLGLSSKQHANYAWDPFLDSLRYHPLFDHRNPDAPPESMSNLQIRNSEVWRRVRAVWGQKESNAGTLYSARTEHRVTGMQPTPADSVANMALQYALTLYLLHLKERHNFDFAKAIPAAVAEEELELANLFGPQAELTFPVLRRGASGTPEVDIVKLPATEIIRCVLPELRRRLSEVGVANTDIDRYIGKFENGEAIGIIAGRAYQKGGRGFCPAEESASPNIRRQIEFQKRNIPIHFWGNL